MPSASKMSSTRTAGPPKLDDFRGRWLITRADAVNLPKGALIEITPTAEREAAFQLTFQHWVGAEPLAGTAQFHQGYLHFLLKDEKKRAWFFQATVALVEQAGETTKFLYGIDLFGDPENAGVWGAEQDGP